MFQSIKVRHTLTVLVIGAFAVMTIISPLLARDEKLLDQGLGMMLTGVKKMNDGMKAVEQGIAMNSEAAKDKADLFAQGNKVIKDGQATRARGMKMLAEGEALITKGKGKDAKLTADSVKMMLDGYLIGKSGIEMINKGAAMNAKVAHDKGFLKLLGPGNKVINDGQEMFTTGAVEFLKGQELYDQNK
jgi:hypothetical protein